MYSKEKRPYFVYTRYLNEWFTLEGPNNKRLNEIINDRPARIEDNSGHGCLYNDIALDMLKDENGVPYNSSAIAPPCFVKDADGNYTGWAQQAMLPSDKGIYAKERIQPKDGKKEYLTIEELKALMATDSYRPEVKQAFIFACFTGLRLSDMYKLAPIHIFKTPDGKGEYIDMEMQKTEKPVIIPLSEEAKRWLPKPKGITTPFFDIPTTQTVIGRALRKWAEAAGVEKHISFHCSRHTFGTMMLTLGADLFTTSKLMGHTNIQTTEIYAKIVDKKKEEAINLIDGMFK